MREQLTVKQRQMLDYMKLKLETDGMFPSLRTAAADLDISHAAVAQTLKVLEEKAYIKREGRYSRRIHLLDHLGGTDLPQRQKRVPVIGNITAGLPMYAQQEWEGFLVVDAKIYPDRNLFALKIQGNSMKDAGILDQDLAICTPRQYADNREIIVALINQEEATVKRFFFHRDSIELRPENPDFKPVFYSFDQVLVQGKVIGIVRGPEGMNA